MTVKKVAIIGLGQLGELLARRSNPEVSKLLYSRNPQVATELAPQIPNSEAVGLDRLKEAEIVIFALPPGAVQSFYQEIKSNLSENALMVNPATLQPTDAVRESCPDHNWIAVKMLGSVRIVSTGKNCNLITDSPEWVETFQHIFKPLGDVISGDENWVAECNSIASYHVLKACIAIEEEIRVKNMPEQLGRQAMALVGSGVVQSYATNTLGHFGKEILARVLKDLGK